jgi:adenine-specific DNA-methyltransferase
VQTPSSCIVYTPKALADAMARVLEPQSAERFLEPCIGNGSLARALIHQGVAADRIRALDLDPRPKPSDHYARVLRGIDFLEWSANTHERFEKIIANPPYLALNRLPRSLRKNALQVLNPFTRTTIGLGANYWYAFLCASISLLESDGSLCFLLPSSWEYSNYARPLRETLPAHFEQVFVHRSRSPLFEDVQEGSVVLVARGYRRPNRTAARIEHATVNDLIDGLATAVNSDVGASSARNDVVPRATVFAQLGELLEIHIGAVTGDAAFFLLTDDERRARRIPVAACVPVLTRSAHVRVTTIRRDNWKALRDSGERVWLFRPTGRWRRHRWVKRYLRLKSGGGGCHRERFKVRARSPWYQTILPENVHGFISGMSSSGPWIALSSMEGLSATNTLYVVSFRKAKTRAERAAIGLALLTTPARDALAAAGRRYADGLLKYEPGDLRRIEIPITARLKGVISRYELAVRKLRNGDSLGAQRLADEWIQSV